MRQARTTKPHSKWRETAAKAEPNTASRRAPRARSDRLAHGQPPSPHWSYRCRPHLQEQLNANVEDVRSGWAGRIEIQSFGSFSLRFSCGSGRAQSENGDAGVASREARNELQAGQGAARAGEPAGARRHKGRSDAT